MDIYDQSWGIIADKYNLVKSNYGEAIVYDFPSHWSNGWIQEMKPTNGLFVSSSWFTPEQDIEFVINTQKPFMWLFCIDCGDIIVSRQGKASKHLTPIIHCIINPQKKFTLTFPKGVHTCFTSVLIFDDFIQNYLKEQLNPPKIRIQDAMLWETQHYNMPSTMLILEQIRWAVRNADMPLLGFEGMVIHLLCSIARNYPIIPNRRSSRRFYVTWENEQKLIKIKELLDGDILNAPDVKELSMLAEMSESKLRQSFKNRYGTPLYEYIRTETMKRAMQLMADDHLSIKNIAQICRYKNPAKFTAAFKDVHGITPREFRKAFNL